MGIEEVLTEVSSIITKNKQFSESTGLSTWKYYPTRTCSDLPVFSRTAPRLAYAAARLAASSSRSIAISSICSRVGWVPRSIARHVRQHRGVFDQYTAHTNWIEDFIYYPHRTVAEHLAVQSTTVTRGRRRVTTPYNGNYSHYWFFTTHTLS